MALGRPQTEILSPFGKRTLNGLMRWRLANSAEGNWAGGQRGAGMASDGKVSFREL